jgi:endoglucanase
MRIRPAHRRGRSLRRLVAVVAAQGLVVLALSGVATNFSMQRARAATLANTPHYSLPLALQESLYFYDAQKSGPARTLGDQPLEWRGDSEPSDSAVPLVPMSNWVGTNMSASFIAANKAILDPDGNGKVDLSGGFHDAGDHVKFGLPASYTASVLGWGMYEFQSAYQATGAWAHSLDEMKWFSDYFLRSLFTDASGNVVAFNYQVGDGSVDHAYWGPSELQSSTTYPRPAYFATAETPASDQTAGAAAALAVEALVVKSSDAAYAARCLTAAKALYAFSVAHRGLGYSGGFYGSSFDEDELAWAAVLLALATGTHSYVNDILATDSAGNYTGWMKKIIGNSTDGWNNIWVMSWDTKWGGVFSLLDPLVQGDALVPAKVQSMIHYIDKWQVEYWSHVPHDLASDTAFIAQSPAGFEVLNGWGSARYNTAAQLEALAYRHHFPTDPKSVLFSDWAMGQMNYLMGDNPLNRSYIVGFGSTTTGVGAQVGGSAVAVSHPHHADAHGSTTNNQDDPPNDRHILWGGLVGGPDLKDQHQDITTDFVYNEVAVDYNAALVGSLAGLYQYYGSGQTVTKFVPPLEPNTDDYYAFGASTQVNSASNQVTVTINNFGARPPHYQTDMSARYYFDISEIAKQGQDISAVTGQIYYDASAASYNQPAKLSAPVRWGDASSCVYYVTLDWTGDDVFGARPLQFGLNEAQTSNWKTYWDPTNDYSYTGLAAGTYASTPDPYVPVYLGGKLVYGQEPSTTLDESCGAASVSPSPSPTGTGTPPTLTAQYADTSGAAVGGQIANKIQLTNTGTTAVPLSALTVRYWFTEDSTAGLQYACDYAPLGCANVTSKFVAVSPAVTGADHYLELGFTAGAGTLYPGNTTGAIQNRAFQSTYGNFSQADDYSYNAADTSLTTWNHITVYYNGTLVYGTPPS